MSYKRVITRNGLRGDYGQNDTISGHIDRNRDSRFIAGDLRRLERDQRDDLHLQFYSEQAGITKEQVKIVLDKFFEGI